VGATVAGSSQGNSDAEIASAWTCFVVIVLSNGIFGTPAIESRYVSYDLVYT
jgi:hypothetical protein